MNNSKEMRELEKLSAGLAPKKPSCKMCKVILIASIVLFVASVALVLLESRNLRSADVAVPQHVTSSAEKSDRIKTLRAYIKEKEGTTTSIIVKSSTK